MDKGNVATASVLVPSDGKNETEGSGSVQGSGDQNDQAMPPSNPLALLVNTTEEQADEWAEGKESDSGVAAVAGSSASASIATSDPTRFTCKLHRMLTEIEDESSGLQHIVSWQPHGRCMYYLVSGASLVTNFAF